VLKFANLQICKTCFLGKGSTPRTPVEGRRPSSGSKDRPASGRHRGSRESLDSVQYDDEQNTGIKTKIFHALGLNS